MVNILRQVIERRLPNSYEYHGIPSPWLQIRILKILALLGAGNQRWVMLEIPLISVSFCTFKSQITSILSRKLKPFCTDFKASCSRHIITNKKHGKFISYLVFICCTNIILIC